MKWPDRTNNPLKPGRVYEKCEGLVLGLAVETLWHWDTQSETAASRICIKAKKRV